MKTIDVYLSEKGISKDVFEGYTAPKKTKSKSKKKKTTAKKRTY